MRRRRGRPQRDFGDDPDLFVTELATVSLGPMRSIQWR